MRSSEFMRALPEAVAQRLPPTIDLHRGRVWSYGVQFYDDVPVFHYEVARITPRAGDRLELGLHFESRDAAANRALLEGFEGHLVEIKAHLGPAVEAEQWDRGWSKVYETMVLEPYETAYLSAVADRLVEIVRVLHPIYWLLRG